MSLMSMLYVSGCPCIVFYVAYVHAVSMSLMSMLYVNGSPYTVLVSLMSMLF